MKIRNKCGDDKELADVSWLSFGFSIAAIVISFFISLIGLIYAVKTHKARFRPYLTLTQYFQEGEVFKFLGLPIFKYGNTIKD